LGEQSLRISDHEMPWGDLVVQFLLEPMAHLMADVSAITKFVSEERNLHTCQEIKVGSAIARYLQQLSRGAVLKEKN
jgi:hypothetical protein